MLVFEFLLLNFYFKSLTEGTQIHGDRSIGYSDQRVFVSRKDAKTITPT